MAPERTAVGRLWSAFPAWLRITGMIFTGAATIAGVTWTGRGVFDRQLATPGAVQELQEWRLEHETRASDHLNELVGQDRVHDHRLEKLEERLQDLSCKIVALENHTSMVGC